MNLKDVCYSEHSLIMTEEDGTIYWFHAEGDCCSSSYIESVDDLSVFKNATLLSIESEHGDTEDISDDEVHKWVFYKFTTTKGRATLALRNESNGYYDGYLDIPDSFRNKFKGELSASRYGY